MPSAPADATAFASSTRWTPLTTIDPDQFELSHSMSVEVTDGSKTVSISPITSSAAPSDSKASGSVVSASKSQRGLLTMPSSVRAESVGGNVSPL